MNDYFQTTWSLNHGIDTYEVSSDDATLACSRAKLDYKRLGPVELGPDEGSEMRGEN